MLHITYPSMSREIITIQGFRTVVHFFLFFFLELTNVDTIKHFFKFLTIHLNKLIFLFPVKTQWITFYLLHFYENQIHTRAISRVFLQALNFHCTQFQLDESTTYNWVILLRSISISLKKGRVMREVPRAQLSKLVAEAGI